MTSAVVFWRLAGACDVHRRVEEKPEILKHVRARVISDAGRNRWFRRSADEEADKAARAPRRRSRYQESMAARERISRSYGGAWRRVSRLQVTGFLGFDRGRSWNTSVVLVSSGEAWSCIYLIGRGTDCLGLRIWTQQ